MIGLTYLLFFILYIILWRWVVKRTRSWAKGSNRNPRRWAIAAHAGMASLIFWDLIPTYALHEYYCLADAGFEQYQTLEQWQAKNPGVIETLKPIKNPKWETKGNRTRVPLNQRFSWDIITTHHPVHIWEKEERIVDTVTGEILAKYIDFGTDILGISRGSAARGISDYKEWLIIRSCETGQRMLDKERFNNFSSTIEDQGGS